MLKTKTPPKTLSRAAMDGSVLSAVKYIARNCGPNTMTRTDAVRYMGRIIESLQAQVEDLEQADL